MPRAQTFTSYINAELTGGTAQQFARLEAMSDRTFDHIRRQAQLTTRAMAGLMGGSGFAGATAGRPNMASTATAAVNGRVLGEQAAIARATRATAAAQAVAAAQTVGLDRANSRLVRGLQATAPTLQIVQGPLGPLAGRISAVSTAVERLTGFRLGLAGVGVALFALVNAGNKAAEIRSRLAPLYETQTQINQAFVKTAGIARDVRVALEPVVELYSRLTLVGRDLNLSPRRIENTTRAAALGARLSGGSRQAQEAGINQLAQGIGSNRLGGDELKSILENTPRIARAIAEGLSNTEKFGKVTIGTLRELGAEGELTADRVTRALGRSLQQLEEEAQRIGPTWSSATAAFGSELTMTVSKVDQLLGLTQSFATGLTFVADNLRHITALTLAVGAGWAAIRIAPKLAEASLFAAKQIEIFQAQKRAAVADRAATAASVAQHRNVVAQLENEKRAIAEKIAALENELVVRRRVAANAGAVGNLAIPGGSARAAEEASRRATMIERRLDGERRRLMGTNAALALSTTNLAKAKDRASTAAERATRQSSLLRRGWSNLIGVINPLGIAVAIATTAILEFAFAESQAEKNARKLEEGQRALAATVDETTGRIREQNAEIRRGLLLRSSDNEKLARQADKTERVTAGDQALAAMRTGTRRVQVTGGLGVTDPRLASAYRNVPVYVGGPGSDRARQLLEGVRDSRIPARVASAELNELAKTNKGLQAAADALARHLPTIQQNSQAVLSEVSYQREAAGIGTEEDRRRLRGDFSGGVPAGGKTLAQLDAEAQALARKMRDDRFAATNARDTKLADLQSKRGKMTDAEYVQERAEILKSYDDEIERIGKAEAAAKRRSEREGQRAERAAEAQARREEAAAERARDRADKLAGIMDRFSAETPIKRLEKLRVEAEKAKRSIQDLVGERVDGFDGAFSQKDADAEKAKIDRFVAEEKVRPITEQNREYERQVQIQQQLLLGHEAEAEALREYFNLQDQVGDLADAELPRLLAQAREQEHINDLLSQRERLVSNLMQSVDDARGILEAFLMDLGRKPERAIKDLARNALDSFMRTRVRAIVENLTAGMDQRVRDLINGRTRVDTAVSEITTGMKKAGSASETLARALEEASARISGAAGSDGTMSSVTSTAGIVSQVSSAIGGKPGSSSFLDAMAGVMEDLKGEIAYEARRGNAANDNGAPGGDIVVTGSRIVKSVDKLISDPKAGLAKQASSQSLPSTREVYNAIGESVGGKLDDALGTKFFKGIGKQFGTALDGAGQGMMASGVAAALGIKQSKTGAAIGGAIGNFIPIPGGAIIGGLIGGTLGGALKKTKKGVVTIGDDGFGGLATGAATGNSNKFKQAATQAGDSLINMVNQIAEQLGGGIDPSRASVSIGVRHGDFRVDTTGKGITKKKKGALDFDGDEQAAITAAVRDMISDGVITGISAASQRILKANKDLDTAIRKASVIESIPKRLMALTDPVHYAVTELNREFQQMIAYLKEGGASAQQFADAQKLYDLERQRAIEEAKQQASGAIQSFLDAMTAGSDSPLNKRTVYGNARQNIDKFTADINAGKLVDQNSLLEAARNFQDASRDLYGSSASFFSDFNFLFDLLSKARDNAGLNGGNVAELPPSPFTTDRSVQDAINGTNNAIHDQTGIVGGLLGDILAELRGRGTISGPQITGGRAINGLPGFNVRPY